MTPEQTFCKAEHYFMNAALDVAIAEQLLKEARKEASAKSRAYLIAAIRVDRENYNNGILELCRTGK
jgi:hypothetical protein